MTVVRLWPVWPGVHAETFAQALVIATRAAVALALWPRQVPLFMSKQVLDWDGAIAAARMLVPDARMGKTVEKRMVAIMVLGRNSKDKNWRKEGARGVVGSGVESQFTVYAGEAVGRADIGLVALSE